jgi:FMN-dependent NADH-azoreductase
MSTLNYVRGFLRFIGIEQIEFVYAEGLAASADHKAAGLASASQKIGQLAA